MDAKHIICLKIGGEWYQTPVIYSEEEFKALMDLIGWDVPFDMRIYHFHGKENECNSVMRERRHISLDIEAFLKSHVEKPYTVLDTRMNRVMQVRRQLGRYAVAYCEKAQAHYIVDLDDTERYRRVSQYIAVPINFRTAAEFVNAHHRHNISPQGHKFSVALEADGEVAGVVIASTPKAKTYNSQTLELNRVCAKPEYYNCCSKLISMAVNIGKTMGYRTFISYILMDEGGASLKAAGFEFAGYTEDSKGWDHPSRPRKMPERYPLGRKKRWIYQI